jgi:AcrR family transcriptional regulator
VSLRASTRSRVHGAVLTLVTEVGVADLTMEGIAARAGAGKQTLYRAWRSPLHVLLDALLAASQDAQGRVVVPDTGDLAADLRTLVDGMVAEMTEPASDAMMRGVLVGLTHDPELGAEVRRRLLRPQLAAIEERLARSGVQQPGHVTELLVGPVLHRWLLGTGDLDAAWVEGHVSVVLRAAATA